MMEKSLLGIWGALLGAWLLSGCSSLVYKEPQEGARARVRFVTTTHEIMVIRGYSDSNCVQNEEEWMRLRDGVLLNSSPKSLGLPLNEYSKNAAKEVYVEAGNQVNLLFSGSESAGTVVYSCGVPFNFAFSENKDYEVKFNWAIKSCSVTVSEINSQAGQWVLGKVATFTNQMDQKNAGCLQQFKKTRLY